MKKWMTLFAVLLCTVLLLATSSGFAQEPNVNTGDDEKRDGFEWLKQFEGTWAVVSEATGDGGTSTSVMSSRAVGERWMINEHRGQFGEMKFEAVQTIGYDAEKKQFSGSWIDSLTSFNWSYTGSIDSTGKKLTLNATGPDWTDASKTRKYRDVYEVKSKNKFAALSQMMNDAGQWETFMTGTMTRIQKEKLKTTVTPFLMFEGKAGAAIDFYKTVFNDTEIVSMTKYAAGENGKEGSVKLATISIAGQEIKCIDSPIKHDFDFTPSFSFFVECENEEQLKDRFSKLSKGGKVMMPLDNYGFSKRFGWVSDQFGISWQLNLN